MSRSVMPTNGNLNHFTPLVPARGTPRRSRRGDPVAGTQIEDDRLDSHFCGTERWSCAEQEQGRRFNAHRPDTKPRAESRSCEFSLSLFLKARAEQAPCTSSRQIRAKLGGDFIPPRSLNSLILSIAWKLSSERTHKSARKGTRLSARLHDYPCQTRRRFASAGCPRSPARPGAA